MDGGREGERVEAEGGREGGRGVEGWREKRKAIVNSLLLLNER